MIEFDTAVEVTERMGEYLRYLLEYESTGAPPPSLREIAEAMGVASTNAVRATLDPLQRRGLVEWRGPTRTRRALTRTLRLTEDGRRTAFAAMCLRNHETKGTDMRTSATTRRAGRT